jgi:predicted ATPase
VRMGVHTGEAEARAGDYFGSAVNRAARLMSIGHGGQVLVSNSTAELARDGLPTSTSLLDLGEHRLKDLIRPEHVYQLVHPALPTGFPPLKSLDAYPNNLPIQLTTFIGREREMAETKRLLSTARLVTLTGSGGTGKTRLALQVAAEELPDYPDGVWLVELAPLTEAEMVLPALTGALDLNDVSGIQMLDMVTNYLRHKRLLLILDNCEHLIDACARLANHLLRLCPSLKILASSREGLGIVGEVTYHVPSLSLPAYENLTSEALSSSEAALLFIERAIAINPHFALTTGNMAAVAQICRRLDGIPLALELAAARVKLFTVEQIAARLDDRFRLLTGGSRTALPRQQTLRALIDWSYDLLSEPERLLLRRLSVFLGGWTFEAAEAVCSDLDVLTLLEQLVNKSLVGMEENQDQARYEMLETIRQYARDKLIESGEIAALRDRHLDYFLRLSEQAEPGLRTGMVFEWFERLAADYDNIRAAIEWGREERPYDALLLLGNLAFFLVYRADDRQQALLWLKDLPAQMEDQLVGSPLSERQLRARSRARIAAGLLQIGQGDTPAASDSFQAAILIERRLGPSFWLAFALGMSASLAMMSGELDRARQAAEEALLLREKYDSRWLLIPLSILLGFEHRLGNQARADQIRQEIHLHLAEVDHPVIIPTFLMLGLDARLGGQFKDAQMYFSEGLKIAQQNKSKPFIAAIESELAHLARQSGDLETASQAYRKLIWQWVDLGHFPAVAHQLECFAYLAHGQGEMERIARLLGAAERLREEIHVPMRDLEQLEYDATLASLRSQLDQSAFDSAWAEGRLMDLERAITYATTTVGGSENLADI